MRIAVPVMEYSYMYVSAIEIQVQCIYMIYACTCLPALLQGTQTAVGVGVWSHPAISVVCCVALPCRF